jgi:hypothetical protein
LIPSVTGREARLLSVNLGAAACLWLAAAMTGAANASGVNDFGVHGVLELPSARMPAEATLTSSYSRRELADIYAIGYQPLPWLETTFRYTIFDPRCGSRRPPCDGLRDRSFEAKFRLLEERGWYPQVVVGLRDMLGTGAWGSEYLAMSKRLGPLDLTLGAGWGRLAGRAVGSNPLIRVSERFAVRDADTTGGGRFAWGDYFSGPDIGVFGAARYSLPRWKVDLLAAYNSDNYARERAIGSVGDISAFSVGLEWQPRDGIRVGLGWRGLDQVGLQFSAAFDTSRPSTRKLPNGFGARTAAPAPVEDMDPLQPWWPRMIVDAEASGVLLRAAAQPAPDRLELAYSNLTYQNEADAIRRVLSLARVYAPPTVERVVLSGSSDGLATHTIDYQRDLGVAQVDGDASQRISVGPPAALVDPPHVRLLDFPHGGLSLNVGARAYLFDPDQPFLYQLFARVDADLQLGAGFSVNGAFAQSLYSEFDRIARQSNSQLPRVRSDLDKYLKQGESRIERLALVKRGSPFNGVYYQAFAGMLEEMYTGAGVEVLYRPGRSRFAVGANAMAVRQRDYDGGFGLLDYEVVTGHVSLYWASPYHDLDFVVHAGRYLAGDIGATFEVQKRFPNGWSVGLWATLTDVPFDVFGEGSFDKGLIFRIPFDAFSAANTRRSYRTLLRSIQRDGGQRIEGWGGALWEDLRGSHASWLEAERPRMLPE